MKGKYIILTKIKDNNPGEPLAGKLPIGSKMIQGYFKYDDITIGNGLYLYPTKELNSGPEFPTSDVIEYNKEKGIVKTVNSTYLISIHD